MWFRKPAIFKFDDIDHEKMVSEMLDIVEFLQKYLHVFSPKNVEFLHKMIELLKEKQCSDNQARYLIKMRNAVMFNIVQKENKVLTIEDEIVETLSLLRAAYHKNKAAFKEQDIFFLKSFANGKIAYDRTTKLLYEIKNRIL